MSEYRIECDRVLGPVEGDRWSAIFGLYEDDRRIREIEVTLSFRAMDTLSAVLDDKGVARGTQQIAEAVLCTEGERRIRERLKVPGRPCPPQIPIEDVDFLEPGRKEDVLRKAGLL